MANIKPYTDEIQNAVYGEEVRSSIINALNKVNDDNDSYQDIKEEIIQAKDDVEEQVDAFDAKIASAQDVTTALVNATSTANEAKTLLETATTNATTAKTNLVSATTSATNAESSLKSATTSAQTATTNATTAKTNLDASISSANTAKSNLDTAISNATTANKNLDTSTSTGNTARTNLETAISNATTARTNLNAVITSAQDIQSSLSGVIANASTAQTNLENATNNANTIYSELSAEHVSAKATLSALQSEHVSAKATLSALQSEDFNANEILAGVTDIKAYLGMIETEDVLGITMDYANKTCTRIAGAKNLSAGSDFDAFNMYGGRKRCNVSDGGTINAYYGDDNYTEDGSNGQVMVYQPKFYYLVAPLEFDKQDSGYGYHLRKANYYVTTKKRSGFKLHPAFYDKNGNELDYILMSAYEGCIYDSSASAYMLNDEQIMDASNDLFSSVANARPASGLTQNLTRPNIEQMAKNRGDGWYSLGIKTVSMEQLLMIIEMGMMNLQTAIGQGVVSITDSSSQSCASFTGSTASLGNATGQATTTKDYSGTDQTASGKVSVTYRGVENFWGNIYKFVYGVNVWGNGSMWGGMPYICSDFNYAESKNSDNYEGAGFCVTNANGYISAMGYSSKYDWLFMASECLGNSSLPVGDYTYVTSNLNGYRIARLGGNWGHGTLAGAFDWALYNGVGDRSRTIGGRLVYVPTAVSA